MAPRSSRDAREQVRVRMTVAYDGSFYRGFAAQPGLKTVGGTLASTLHRVTRHEVDLVCAGRTDAGVHAWGQVVSFDLPAAGLDLGKIQRAVNKLCGPSIVVREIAVAPADFHARYSAKARRYRYTVLNRDVPDPFLAPTSWWVPQPLDLHAMVMACDPFIGEHDFASFCKLDKGRTISAPSMRRRVVDAHWDDAGDGVLQFWIEANAFCHQMVRSIVGTIVDAGRMKKHAGEITAILRARDRSLAATLAPAHGLCLWEVTY
ncbi:MAG: tRNA pseudouridine(38-40) synthase TruA [Actinobacteria bacterium]|nr:tRNA pseudouridine(38-40) synthase TruA [Actinomycetota bacterium]